jgi:hypothetical protein
MNDAGSPCPAQPAEIRQSSLSSFTPANAFSQEQPAKPLMLLPQPEEQTGSFTTEQQVKPFTQAEQVMFDRASNVN